MKTVKAFCIVLFAFAILGCRSVKYVPVETVVVDSIAIKDTLFEVKLVPYKDSIATKDTTSYLSNAYAYSWARFSHGLLQHSLGIWPFATTQIKVPYFIDRYHYEDRPTIVEVEKKLSRWQQIKMELGGYAMVLIAASVLVLIGRVIYKFIKK